MKCLIAGLKTACLIVVLTLVVGSTASCSKTAVSEPVRDAEYGSPFEAVGAPESSIAGARERVVLLSEERLQEMRRRMTERVEPATNAGVRLATEVVDLADLRPSPPGVFFVPRAKDDRVGRLTAVSALRQDAMAAYALALWYQLTGEEESASQAASLILAWIRDVREYSEEDSSELGFAVLFPYFVIAADLVEGSEAFGATEVAEFSTFLREVALHRSEAERFSNNRGDWGLALEISVAAFLQDEVLLDKQFARWKAFADEQFAADGSLPAEVVRNRPTSSKGIHYTHVALKALTLAAEMLRANGRDVYSYRTTAGVTLEDVYRRTVGWVEDPASFEAFSGESLDELVGVGSIDYWEILHARWPGIAKPSTILAQRPTGDYFTLTHGGMDPAL